MVLFVKSKKVHTHTLASVILFVFVFDNPPHGTCKTPFLNITASWCVSSQLCEQVWIGRPVSYKQSFTSVGIKAIISALWYCHALFWTKNGTYCEPCASRKGMSNFSLNDIGILVWRLDHNWCDPLHLLRNLLLWFLGNCIAVTNKINSATFSAILQYTLIQGNPAVVISKTSGMTNL